MTDPRNLPTSQPTTLRDGTPGVVIAIHARQTMTLTTVATKDRKIAVWAETVGVDLKTPVEVWWCGETIDDGPKFATHQCASRDEAVAALHAMCTAGPPADDPPASPAPRGLFDLLAEMKAKVERGDGKLKIVMPKWGWDFVAKDPWPSLPAISRLIGWAKPHVGRSPWVLDLTSAEAVALRKAEGPDWWRGEHWVDDEYVLIAINGVDVVARCAPSAPIEPPIVGGNWTPMGKLASAIEQGVYARQKKCERMVWGREDFDTSEARQKMVDAVAETLEAALKEQGLSLTSSSSANTGRSLGVIADEVESLADRVPGIYEGQLLQKAAGYLRDVGAVTELSLGDAKKQGAQQRVPPAPRLPPTDLYEQLEDHARARHGKPADVEHDVARLLRAAELVRAVAHGKNVSISGAVRDIIDAALRQVDGPVWVDPTPAPGEVPGAYHGWEIASEVAAGSDVGRRYVRAALHAGVMAEAGRVAALAADDIFRIDALAIEAIDPITKERVFVPPSKAGPSPKDMTHAALLAEVGEHRKVLHTLRRMWGVLGVQKGETLLTAAQRMQSERDHLRAAIESSGRAAREQAGQSILDQVKDVLQVREGSPLHEAGYAPTTPMQAGDLVKLAERVMRSWTREAQATTATCRVLGDPASADTLAAKVKTLVEEVDGTRLHFRAKTGERLVDAVKRCRDEDLWEIQAVRLKVGARDGETMVAAISRWADARDAGVRNALHAKPSETTVEAACRLWNASGELAQVRDFVAAQDGTSANAAIKRYVEQRATEIRDAASRTARAEYSHRPVLTPARLHEMLYFAARCGFVARLVREVIDANEAFLGQSHVTRLRGVLASDPVDDLAYDTVLIGKTRDGHGGIWHEVSVVEGQWRDQLWRQAKGQEPGPLGPVVLKTSLSTLFMRLAEDGVESASLDEALPHLVVMDAVRRSGFTIGGLGTYDARVEETG